MIRRDSRKPFINGLKPEARSERLKRFVAAGVSADSANDLKRYQVNRGAVVAAFAVVIWDGMDVVFWN